MSPWARRSRHHHLGQQGHRRHQAYGKLAALQPGSAEWPRQMQQIEGFPVLQESDVTMGGSHFKTREELATVETKDAPAGTLRAAGRV